jgi:hypothetical protein
MFLGFTLGGIPVLLVGLSNMKRAATDSNATVVPNVYNATAAAASDGGGNVSAVAMVLGGSIWCFIGGITCLGMGAYPSLSLCARPSRYWAETVTLVSTFYLSILLLTWHLHFSRPCRSKATLLKSLFRVPFLNSHPSLGKRHFKGEEAL